MKKVSNRTIYWCILTRVFTGVNISKFHRAYIAQDENNVAF